MIEKPDTFCLAPWVSIHTWPDGKVFPCCLWNSRDPVGNVNAQSLEEIWNNEKMKKIRRSFLKGEKLKSCDRCFHLEDTVDQSYRQRINKDHKDKMHYVNETNQDGSLNIMNLHLWDVRISNFCNFKCRSCGLGLSSSWYSDSKALGEKVDKALININDKASFMDMLEPHYNCVDEIYFAGGEPLVMPEHYQILDRLLELGRTDVNIRYSTNFSKLTYKGKHIFDYWKHFPNLELYISIDGVGKIGEYVRKGFDDKLFYDNIMAFKKSGLKVRDYGYAITYGTLNYLHLFDMMLDFIDRGYLDTNSPVNESAKVIFSPIDYPAHYDSVYLPDRFKVMFGKRLEGFNRELLDKGVSRLFANTIMYQLELVYKRSLTKEFDHLQMAKCKSITDQLDKIRKEKFYEIFDYYKNSNDFVTNIKSII
jgi:radical SAM protein with 4Fe4S-binding SPASM domain